MKRNEKIQNEVVEVTNEVVEITQEQELSLVLEQISKQSAETITSLVKKLKMENPEISADEIVEVINTNYGGSTTKKSIQSILCKNNLTSGRSKNEVSIKDVIFEAFDYADSKGIELTPKNVFAIFEVLKKHKGLNCNTTKNSINFYKKFWKESKAAKAEIQE